ncbi:MAG: hypothetical protein AAB656_03140 [Patescibacteria group bacterium]
MKKNTIVFISILIFLLLVGAFYFSKTKPSEIKLPTGYEYYWGDGCPHCANVAAFLESWDKKDKINLQKLEVWSNPTNAKLMQERYSYCKVDKTQMGVPLLFTPDGKCLVGDVPIIDFLKNIQL